MELYLGLTPRNNRRQSNGPVTNVNIMMNDNGTANPSYLNQLIPIWHIYHGRTKCTSTHDTWPTQNGLELHLWRHNYVWHVTLDPRDSLRNYDKFATTCFHFFQDSEFLQAKQQQNNFVW